MKRSLLLSSLAIAGSMALSAPASAQCTGTCGTTAPNGNVTAPPGGGTIQFVTTDGGVAGAGQIAGVGGSNGSQLISDVFSAAAGDPLSFAFNYITSDGSNFSDYGFAELQTAAGVSVGYLFTARTTPSGNTSPGFGLPSNIATLNPASTPIQAGTTFSALGASSGSCYSSGCGNTGWIQSLFNFDQAGQYRVRFGVTNVSDSSYQSALAFSGLQVGSTPIGVGAVPEPGTWALMLIGFGAIGASMRRRRVSAIAQMA